jgi:hypothetical protein
MTIKETIKIMQNERKCVETAENDLCDRNCGRCELVMPAKEILEAYDVTIGELEYIAKHQPMIGKEL